MDPKGQNILFRSQLEQKDHMIQMLSERLNEKDETITDLKETIRELKETISGLQETLNEFQRKLFGMLPNYLLDGRCEISNNRAERKAKSYAIGRKAFLFHTSEAGAGVSAVMYSIVETAKANNLNIFQYLYTVLLYMPDYMNSSAGIEQLMLWSDFIKEQCSGLIDVESNVPENRIPLPLS